MSVKRRFSTRWGHPYHLQGACTECRQTLLHPLCSITPMTLESYTEYSAQSKREDTPEAISILVYDLAQNAHQPYAVLTGDTLFIGDVGRLDLMASCGLSTTELAGMLYDSLHHKLLPLPAEILVYPAHGAGSLCGKNLSSDLFSSLGVQRRTNAALQPMS